VSPGRPLRILCLNSGSSSLKFAVFDLDDGEHRRASGAVEGVGATAGRLWIQSGDGARRADAPRHYPNASAALDAVFGSLRSLGIGPPDAVGHRVVQGGMAHGAPQRIDEKLVDALARLVALAPLHLPAEIDGIEAVTKRFPGIPQVACFDTAFHRTIPEIAQRLPLPRRMWDEGIRRYGYHGLSYEYVVEHLGAATLGRAVIAHLGNGASAAAIRDGRSVDTTMGFTPTGGFMMGTRSGDLDPGTLLYLITERGYDAAALKHLVECESGLLGVSGLSSDMKLLLERRAHDPHAAQAVEMFCYQLRKRIGSLAAVLGGLDTLVFTGGIGEHAAPVRSEVCRDLGHLGVRVDEERNARGEPIISDPASPCTVRVVRTDEDLMIARHTRRLLEA
jgi:acetate kinase